MYFKIRHFLQNERGAAGIEYALIAAGISIAVITLLGHAGDDVKAMVDTLRHIAGSFNLRLIS